MAVTPNLNLPLIDGSMTADVPRDQNALALAIDTVVGPMSTHANKTDNPHSVTTEQVNKIPAKLVGDLPAVYPIGLSVFSLSSSLAGPWKIATGHVGTGDMALNQTAKVNGDYLIVQRLTFHNTAGVTGVYERTSSANNSWTGPWIKVVSRSEFENLAGEVTAHLAESASETVKGHVELATAAETTTGTDNTRAVHPAGLKVELDKKLSNSGGIVIGDVILSGTDRALKKDADNGRMLLAGSSGASASIGAYIALEGLDFLGAGAGGNASIVVTAGKSLNLFSGFNSIKIFLGTGSPEGVVTAGNGSLYLRLDGSTTTTLYVKTSGSGNTGWTAK